MSRKASRSNMHNDDDLNKSSISAKSNKSNVSKLSKQSKHRASKKILSPMKLGAKPPLAKATFQTFKMKPKVVQRVVLLDDSSSEEE